MKSALLQVSHAGGWLILACALSLAACQKPVAEVAPEATPEPGPASVATSTPKPEAPATPVAVSATPDDPLATEGVFFLLAKASVTTEDGIIGVPPGTRVQLVSAGQYRDDEGHALALRDDQVTNNLRRARAAAGADAKAQAALRQTAARQEAAAEQARAARAKAAAAAATPTASHTTTEPSRRTSAPFDPHALGAHMRDGDYLDSEGKRHWRDGKGLWHID